MAKKNRNVVKEVRGVGTKTYPLSEGHLIKSWIPKMSLCDERLMGPYILVHDDIKEAIKCENCWTIFSEDILDQK